MLGVESKKLYVGEEARRIMNVMKLSYPIESGIVTSWNMME
jgi:actin-related protein